VGVKLHRCGTPWKFGPCWRVQKALDDQGIHYEIVTGPWRPKNPTVVIEGTGQALYPVVQFEDGGWYREESKEMARTINEGRLMGSSPLSQPGKGRPAFPPGRRRRHESREMLATAARFRRLRRFRGVARVRRGSGRGRTRTRLCVGYCLKWSAAVTPSGRTSRRGGER
jgi:hypothetical protein